LKPALSVVAFTVLSGAGLGALAIAALLDVAGAATVPTLLGATLVGLVLTVAGLCASTLHLGNPRNAWRSLSRLRTSWLSREAGASLALLPIAAAYVAALYFDTARGLRIVLAVATIALAWVTLYCTAMIYASLKPIRHWHTPRVPLAYFLLGHASGALVVVAALRIYGEPALGTTVAAGLVLAAAAVAKLDYYIYIAGERGRITLEEAIGVTRGVGTARAAGTVMRARLLDVGHSRGTFLTREFGYTLDPAQRVALRTLFWSAGVVVPALWLAVGLDDGWGAAIAMTACLVGLGAERWLFFAEARHTVRLYHGDRST
jgi:DMSO reductase anchor subunit